MTDDSDTDADDERVWLVTASNNTNPVYHTDPDCRHLDRAEHRVRSLSRAEAERWNRDACDTCTGFTARPDPQTKITCPHCGKTVFSLGRHVPCDDGDTADDDRVRGGVSSWQ